MEEAQPPWCFSQTEALVGFCVCGGEITPLSLPDIMNHSTFSEGTESEISKIVLDSKIPSCCGSGSLNSLL